MPSKGKAVRATVRGGVQGVGLRDATVRRAGELGALGWVRNGEDGSVLVHAEGDEGAVDGLVEFLGEGPGAARVSGVEVESAKVEGHEQFAVRGVDAGEFVVARNPGTGGFELRLEVDGARRCWALPKGPSMDPAAKRFAIEVGEGAAGEAIAWDRGGYEQGGRVPWPEAIERGHAVFVLHGERLRGGFALQRTRSGEKPQWLLIKRKDAEARPGSDVVGEG
jgi:DNA ligase D-like protein (predicted 3'-phosphoesterase)